jgi:carbon-monoxide dehydrogenase large subunit
VGIGARQLRLEDRTLLTGQAHYASDLRVADLVYATFVRSPVAHARIASVECGEALEQEGVIAVLTDADLNIGPVFLPAYAHLLRSASYHRRPLAKDVVRFVGEIVAIVIAESEAIGEDAAELVMVDYEPLPIVVDPRLAAADDAPLLFPETGTNVAVDIPFEGGVSPRDIPVSVRQSISHHRMAVSPMEGSSIVSIPSADTPRLTVYASTQMPHGLRDVTAHCLGLDPSDIHVITPAVGGGFGGKTPSDPDYVAVIAASLHVNRPLRWTQTRNENLLTMHARGHSFDVTLGATARGELRRLQVEVLTDVGAYPGIGCGQIFTTRSLSAGPYGIPHLRFDVRCVATNTAPVGSFRGAGRPEATAMIERCLDILAAKIGLDPVEIRRRNLLREDQFPFKTVTGVEYDSGRYESCLDEAILLVDYRGLREEQARRRRSGDHVYLGIGICFYVEISATAPGFGTEYASVEIMTSGRVLVKAGTAAHGQGHHTVYAQIVETVLGVPAERVDFIDGDTGLVPSGVGTGGSRSMQVGGSAVRLAADAVLRKATELAAHVLEADRSDIVIGDDGLRVAGVPESEVRWSKLAALSQDPQSRPEGLEPGLAADPGFRQSQAGTAPFGCHIAVVEVDSETGFVRLRQVLAVDDCGEVINPLLAQGQVHGGVFAGAAHVLFEEVRYDEDGNCLTASLLDYAFPSAAEIPSIDTGHTVTPTPHNPLGAKGIGEAGITGSMAAIHNAVVDAVSHLGIRHIDLPLTPFRVWSAIRDSDADVTSSPGSAALAGGIR